MNYDFKKIKEPLLWWYQKGHRDLPWRENITPYSVWLSEIMLQQTRALTVIDYYERFLVECPDIKSLSELSEERLLKLWEGLGYYNRARNLKKTAGMIMEQYQGEFPKNYEEILSLSGIGEYTAGAICSICYNQKTPAVDGNVLRVMTRLSNWSAVIDEQKTKKAAREYLLALYEDGDCALLTQSLMELGAVVCIPNGMPKCEECPLQSLCEAYRLGTYMDLPVRKEKKKRKIENKTVFILNCENDYGIVKRPDDGLLANMWEFPNVKGHLSTQEALQYISRQGYEPVTIEKMIPYTHIFSHVEWHMKAYYIVCNKKRKNLTWVKISDLKEKYALPTAFRAFL